MIARDYGTDPATLLRLPLGEFAFVLAVHQEGTAWEALERQKAEQRARMEARGGSPWR